MTKYGFVDEELDEFAGQARIVVVGVGGAGGNAVEHMVQYGVKGVTFVVANTDRQALDSLTVPNKFQLGANGLGAGGNPEVGRAEAESSEDELRAMLNDYDLVFIAAGMGGGTGTGAAPVIARIAKEMDKLVVAVVATPFKLEGGKRTKLAKQGVDELNAYVNSIITIPNEKLQYIYSTNDFDEALNKSNDVLLYAVKGLIEVIHATGKINVDFNDVRTVMSTKGYAMMGVGRAGGQDRAKQAAEKAIRSPLLDDNLRLENAQGLLINITAANFAMNEMNQIYEVVSTISELEDSNIFYGVVYDDSLGDDIQVTVIATGFAMDERPKTQVRPTQQPYAQANIAPQREPVRQPQEQNAPKAPQTAQQPADGQSEKKPAFSVEQFLQNQYK